MKNLNFIPVLLALLLLLVATVLHANDDKYIDAMKKNIEQLNNAKSTEDLQSAINGFERIAQKETAKWEPLYYASYGTLMTAMREPDATKKDVLLDKALAAAQKAAEVKPTESEIVALIGFVHMIRVTVDPASRGQQYSGMAFQEFSKAVKLNPENPRALALLSQMQFGTAKFFGSSTDEACGTNATAIEKFEMYTNDNPLAPTWGKDMTEQLKGACK